MHGVRGQGHSLCTFIFPLGRPSGRQAVSAAQGKHAYHSSSAGNGRFPPLWIRAFIARAKVLRLPLSDRAWNHCAGRDGACDLLRCICISRTPFGMRSHTCSAAYFTLLAAARKRTSAAFHPKWRDAWRVCACTWAGDEPGAVCTAQTHRKINCVHTYTCVPARTHSRVHSCCYIHSCVLVRRVYTHSCVLRCVHTYRCVLNSATAHWAQAVGVYSSEYAAVGVCLQASMHL